VKRLLQPISSAERALDEAMAHFSGMAPSGLGFGIGDGVYLPIGSQTANLPARSWTPKQAVVIRATTIRRRFFRRLHGVPETGPKIRFLGL
jgi:hypothetical protein